MRVFVENMAAQVCVSLLLVCVSLLLVCLSSACHHRDLYQTLRVEPTATDREIKQAFRQLALKYHPDKSNSLKAEHTFREITEAYKVLSSLKDKRRRYDTSCHEMLMNNEATPDPDNGHQNNHQFSFSDQFFEFDSDRSAEEPHWIFSQDQFIEIPDFKLYFEDADFEDEHY